MQTLGMHLYKYDIDVSTNPLTSACEIYQTSRHRTRRLRSTLRLKARRSSVAPSCSALLPRLGVASRDLSKAAIWTHLTSSSLNITTSQQFTLFHRYHCIMAYSARDASMAPPPSGPLHRERYTIAPASDHLLVVIPSTIITSFVNGVFEDRKGPPQAAYEFEVRLEALHKMAYFRRTIPLLDEKPLLDGEDKASQGRTLQDKAPEDEAPQDKATYSTSELYDDDPRAWRLWLEMLHGCLNVRSYQAQIVTVWHVLRIADKYDINPTCADAGAWFDQWFFAQSSRGLFTTNENVRQILFPCHAFDHALGFSTSTMWLAYNSTGHIEEKRPKEFEQHPRMGLDRGIERMYRRPRDLRSILTGYQPLIAKQSK